MTHTVWAMLYEYPQTNCEEGAKDVNNIRLTSVIFTVEPKILLLRAYQEMPTIRVVWMLRAPLFRFSNNIIFIRTSVQPIEPWLCFITICPELLGHSPLFFVLTSIFNSPNWNWRMKAFTKFCAKVAFSSYRKNLHVSNDFVPMLSLHTLIIFRMGPISTHQYP